MKLQIRQRVFSWTDSYDIYDEWGNPKYFVKAKFFSLSHELQVYDKQNGSLLGVVRQKLLTLMPTFEIEIGGQVLGTVRQKFTLFSQNYQVDYLGWEVEGDFLGWDYQVLQDGSTVMTIHKELLSWEDSYALEYDRPANELPALMLVLAIDAANCSHND